ncbi:MAG: hypothetical protein PHQ59_03555 [Candidatus Daviesbacteria bacterium]|nr:hypothetical protein [Candidatus Daviesbacteria bacterium]
MSTKEQPSRFDELARRDIEQAGLLKKTHQKASKIFPDTKFEKLTLLEKMTAIYSSETVATDLNGRRNATPSEIAKVINPRNIRRY